MIEQVKLRGWIGIKRGMGLDEISIDFTGREGMVCFDGPNGTGKSSVIDHLSPFDLLPSRDGALKNHVELRDSLRELSFTHNGHSYKTVIKVDAQSGKSEGFAYVDGSTASVVTGAISAYHRWAIETFGSPELFFASYFCAQSSKKITDMRVGELKGLFVEFLRLERYEAWAETSKQAGNALIARSVSLDSRIDVLKTIVAGKESMKAELDTSEHGKLVELNGALATLKESITANRKKTEDLQAVIARNNVAAQRREELQKQIDGLTADLAREKAAAEEEIAKLRRQWTDIEAEIVTNKGVLANKAEIERAAGEIAALEKQVAEHQAKTDEFSKELPNHQQKVHDIETEIGKLQVQLKALEDDPALREIKKEIEDAGRLIADQERLARECDPKKDADAISLTLAVSAAKEKMAALEVKDPACQSTTCSFITAAIEAKGHLPELENRLAKREQTLARREVEVREIIVRYTKEQHEKAVAHVNREKEILAVKDTLTALMQSHTHDLRNAQQVVLSATQAIDGLRLAIATLRGDIAKKKALADRLPEIKVAESRLADLDKQLKEVTIAGAEKKKAWEAKEHDLGGKIFTQNSLLRSITVDETAEKAMKEAQEAIRQIEAEEIPAHEKAIRDLQGKIATLQANIRKVEESEKELDGLRAEKEALLARIANWKYLQTACGKNGLQALEIDGAAPLISARANELLTQGYGPQFTVRIDTQDEEGREDLDIKVLSEYGEDSLKLKSGGEKVWLLQPVRLAMTLISKEKGGTCFDTACFDEIDGPLDSKGAATNFMEMYRPFMQAGNLRQLIFITHRDECRAYADHVLRFERGKNPTWQ